jgi:hypothetical protein
MPCNFYRGSTCRAYFQSLQVGKGVAVIKKVIHKACRAIFAIAILNFLLFFIITLVIGGDAINGEIVDGHYYLGGGGRHTEVNYYVFMFSKLHAISVFITHPLAMLSVVVYAMTGGDFPWSYVTPVIEKRPTNPILSMIFNIRLFIWKISDFIEGVFWMLFDSWREPHVEFFTKLSKEQCIARLAVALDEKSGTGGYISGTHFYLFKQRKFAVFYRNNIYLTLFGKLVSTPRGTYVRAWHRFVTSGIIFLALWFGMASTLLIIALTISLPSVPSSLVDIDSLILFACVTAPVIAFVVALISIWFGGILGQKNNAQLGKFLQFVLTN